MGSGMSGWATVYTDSDKRIERRQTAQQGDLGPVAEERTIWTNPDCDGARMAALTDAVDTLILDSLGGE